MQLTMSDQFGLEAYLYEHIPLSKHLGVRVEHAGLDSVRLLAPLEPNLNHRQTGFGGSICAVAILAGWSLLWYRLHDRAAGSNIVIQRNSVDYITPVTADFTATCVTPSAAHWKRFEDAFEQRGRGRIDLDVEVHVADKLTARFAGRFVAFVT
jgi:thioesterase domain-containing protein